MRCSLYQFDRISNIRINQVGDGNVQIMDRFELLQRIAASRMPMTTDTKRGEMIDTMKFPKMPSFVTGELLEHQFEHVDKLVHILKRRGSAGDTSPPGSGKTVTSSCVAKKLGLPVMVFCPKSVIPDWYRILT
jgi:superfamily II DNA or RNA helicase